MLATHKMMTAGLMPDPEFIGYTNHYLTGSPSSITVSLHADAKPGDTVVALLGFRDSTDAAPITMVPSDTTGWAHFGGVRVGTDRALRVVTRVIQPGDTSYTFEMQSGTAQRMLVALLVFRYATPDQAPYGSFVALTGNGNLVVPTIAPIRDGLLLSVAATFGGSNNSATATTPTGMAALYTTSTTNGGIRFHVFIEEVPAGDTGTRTTTIGNNPIYFSLAIPVVLIGAK